jgi:glutamate N-acetyltransferase/amino-acid N-acetyltransferase
LLASGAAGVPDAEEFAQTVRDACSGLARQMVGDAEGATKVILVRVTGAASDADAAAAARKVAESQLVKCSFYGEDPYWGRVVSELGSSGAAFDPDKVSVSYGDETVCAGGVAHAHDAGAVAAHLAERNVIVAANLGLGSGEAVIFTNDLTHAYIDENMRTS